MSEAPSSASQPSTAPIELSQASPAIRAILWDMDGLLVDTEPLWTIAETKVCEAVGGRFTAELKARMVGTRLDTAMRLLADDLEAQGCGPQDTDHLGYELLMEMVQLFKGEVTFLPGAQELLAAATQRSIPCALVSSSYRILIDAVSALLPAGTFALSIAGDEVEHAKPHPEPYLTAAAALGLSPHQCLVLEDSPSGMDSATAAGCQAVMVPSVAGVRTEAGWTVTSSLVNLRF